MQQPISSDATIYIALLIGLVILYRFFKSTQKMIWPVNSILKSIILIVAVLIILSGIFYWHIRKIAVVSNFDAFETSIDISLVHLVITLPVLAEGFSIGISISNRLANFIGPVIMILGKGDRDDTDDSDTLGDYVRIILLIIFMTLIYGAPILGVLWFSWFIFIGTIDLQKILFGNFDRSLGWNFPTTFRFTILYNQIRTFVGNNSTLTTIISFIAFSSSIALAIAGSISGLKSLADTIARRKSRS